MDSPLVNIYTGQVPDVLRIRKDGTLYCLDGSDPAVRLKALYEKNIGPWESEFPVVIMHRDTAKRLASDSIMLRSSAA